MDDNFVSAVAKALELVRKRDYLALGKHEIAQLAAVRQRGQPTDPHSTLGQEVMTLLGELLDSRIRPEGTLEIDRVDWRRYLILQEYVFRSQNMVDTMNELNIGQALFYDTKSQATEVLAGELWKAEQGAKRQIEDIPHNIPPRSFDFIPRVDSRGRDLVQLIVDGLQTRPWVVSIRGFGGVGKTTLAIEAAWAAINLGLFDRVAWVGIAPDQASSSELLGYILDTIGKRLGSRKVLALENIDERRELVLALVAHAKCLVVIDNTETVPDEQHEQIVQFVRDLPLPTCALIVSRQKQRKTELETMIQLEGMHEREALKFLRARASEQFIGLDAQQARYLCQVTRRNPRAMLLALGWMAQYGLPAEDVLEPQRAEMSELLYYLLGRVYERLDDDEETILNVMPLFSEPVGWSPVAAAAGLGKDPVRVKAALGNLHSRFLLDIDATKRYTIAPLTHMFLQDRRQTPGARTSGQPASDFWAQANLALIDHCIEEFKNANALGRMQLMRQYKATILDELRWAAKPDQHQRLTDLMYYVGGPLGELGYWRDKLTWGQAAVRAAQKVGDPTRAAWHTIYDVGWTYIQRGEFETGRTVTERGLAEAQQLDYARGVCIARRNLAIIELHRGNHTAAAEQLEHALSTAESQNIPNCRALAKATLGELKLRLGEPAEAYELFQDAFAVYEEMGSASSQSITLSQLAL
ncbi:MAG TPA: tetratricopeptide repeat protein, partial [Anaerolineae bacterium]|nr:tetratricopeptide repeat protein [Anaerolineae bacterium]